MGCKLLQLLLSSKKGGASATYTVSGEVVDAADAGVDGVTVVLSGDASDSTVTAGGGLYSFTGLADGSYTVTPTSPTNRQVSPASRAANVSGDNVTVDDFISYFMYVKTFNDETTGQVPSEGALLNPGGTAMTVESWYQSDGAAWNPAGFSKALKITGIGANENSGYKVQISEDIPTDVSLNFEALITGEQITGDFYNGYPGGTITDGTESERIWMNHYSEDQDIYTGVTSSAGNETANAGNVLLTDEIKSWIKNRIVVHPAADNPNMTTTIVRAEPNTQTGPTVNQQNSKLAGVAGLDYLDGRHYNDVSGTGNLWIGRLYIGDSNLGWPSDT